MIRPGHLAAVVLAGAAIILSPLEASAADTVTLSVANHAKIAANGVLIVLRVAFTCPVGNTVTGTSGASVEEAVGGTIAYGSGALVSPLPACTGALQPSRILVVADLKSPPFVPGTAVATQVNVLVCNAGFNCFGAVVGPKVIQIGT